MSVTVTPVQLPPDAKVELSLQRGVFPKRFAVVRYDCDHRILAQAGLVEERDQAAELRIEVSDRTVVERDDMTPMGGQPRCVRFIRVEPIESAASVARLVGPSVDCNIA